MPPVTEDLSPPDSRITGADSPVTALSSTDAMPSITSPSLGMVSPASTKTISPLRIASEPTISKLPSALIFFACRDLRALRRLSACALPRPSATASAKLANRTVNHSHKSICRSNQPSCVLSAIKARTARTATKIAPRKTMNITGFFHWIRGSSFRNALRTASPKISCCCLSLFISDPP